ncbi:MAG TPA: hypothetical protein VF384_07540 [Planctomycetota bacterium]
MTRNERTVPLILTAALLALDTAHAQDPPVGIWRPVFLPATLATQATSQPVAGNFTGHGYPDIAFLAGSQVGLIAAPAVHNTVDPITSLVATGIATTKGPATTGRDGLAIATIGGLKQWWLGRPITTIAPDPWHSVAVGDLDGLGAEDFVGIGNDARTMLRVWLRGQVNQPLDMSFPPGETITAVVVAQWDGVGAQEICVATNQRLWIATSTLHTVAERAQLNAGDGQLVRVPMPDYDSLAWLTTIDGVPRLMTTNKDLPGFFCDPSIQIGAAHAAAGSWNGDAFGDLVVTGLNSNVMRVFTNDAGTTGLAQFTDNWQEISPADPQTDPPVLSWTWLGDFNADGLADLVTLQNNLRAWVFRQAPIPGTSLRPILGSSFSAIAVDPATVEYTIPVSASSRPSTATHLELLLFSAVSVSNSLALQPAGLSRRRYEVLDNIPPSSFSFQMGIETVNTQARVGVVRWIRLVESTTVEVFQPTLFVIATNDMEGPFAAWQTTRRGQAPNDDHCYSQTFPGTNYLWRPLGGAAPVPPEFWGHPGGVEDPPDLPPKPPEPPTPPPEPPPPTS